MGQAPPNMAHQSKRLGPPNTTGSGPVRLRQIALVARDLHKARELLTAVLGTEVIYIDPNVAQWGLANFLVAVGGDVIEVVSPFRDGTAAGRVLDRRGGDGGYMLIMQHPDARQRRKYIEEKKLAKVIYAHEDKDSYCVQYHPKGIKGGVIPELDSHNITEANPNPLADRFSPWHPCGPDEQSYIAGMKRNADLSLLGVVCRLRPSDGSGELAATQWEQIFGVPRNRDQIAFTNARAGFIHGEDGRPEGIVSISIGVRTEDKRKEIFRVAKERRLVESDGAATWINMFGIRWSFFLTSNERSGKQSKI